MQDEIRLTLRMQISWWTDSRRTQYVTRLDPLQVEEVRVVPVVLQERCDSFLCIACLPDRGPHRLESASWRRAAVLVLASRRWTLPSQGSALSPAA